ncbi:MAG: hypothetical protein JHC12_00640 [Thermogladius sp.]|nr:hypothetical protein [Thermogladius sp.]
MNKIALLILSSLIIAALYTIATASTNTLYINVASANTLDETGAKKTTFTRGQLVLVNATLQFPSQYYAPPSLSFLYIVKFQDSNGVTFYYGIVKTSLEQGKTGSYVVGGKIPENAPLGTYKAVIYVWSNWPAYGFTAYSVSYEVTFTVCS